MCQVHHLILQLFVVNTLPPDQQPMAVHAIRRTCQQRHQIHVVHSHQISRVLRLYHRYPIHLITERLIQNIQKKYISLLQLIQIREQCRTGQSSVSGDDRMIPSPSHRKRAPRQMACRHLKHGGICRVIDRKLYTYFRHLHISHHAISCQVQAGHIFPVRLLCVCRSGERIREDIWLQRIIVLLRPLPFFLVVDSSRHTLPGYRLFINGNQFSLAVVVPFIGDKRIQQQGQTGQEQQ